MTTENKSEAQKPEETPIHNLFTRETPPIQNWYEWLKRWQTIATLDEVKGLLHTGFEKPIGYPEYGKKQLDWIDRVVFYLGIADGWADDNLLRLPTDIPGYQYALGIDKSWRVVKKSQSEIRQIASEKAFDMVCLNFFKNISDESDFEGDARETKARWETEIANERLFPVITNFFRVEKGKFGNDMQIRNLTPRYKQALPNEKHAISFLLGLAHFLFTPRDGNPAVQARTDGAKPWMIEALLRLDEHTMLNRHLMDLDDACLTKLREIAMRTKFGYSDGEDGRTVATLDEACYLNSSAAWLLKRHELKMREHKRLTAIRDAKRAKDRAERELKELTES